MIHKATHARVLTAAFFTATVLTTTSQIALGNGRFPVAQHVVVGPGDASQRIVLRATFGLMVSDDAGQTFRWICEEAMGYAGLWDPPVALGTNARIIAGTPTGVVSIDGCSITTDSVVGTVPIADLDHSADGTIVLGMFDQIGQTNRVFRSGDGGRTFALHSQPLQGITLKTLEMAPSQPMRVYVSGLDEQTRAPRLLRSNDGGVTFSMLTPDFQGGEDAWIAGVDPTQPDRLYIRSNRGAGTILLRSDDGGNSLQLIATSRGPMLGVAVSEDGRSVWYGGPSDGLWRSSDNGAQFQSISQLRVTCLRHHRGALYVCGDWLSDPFALGRWDDGASAPVSLLRFQDVVGPMQCTNAPGTWDQCVARWPAVRAMFGTTTTDAGPRDSGFVADSSSMDADAQTIGSEPASVPSCRCNTIGHGPSRGIDAIMAVVVGWCLRPRKKSRSEHAQHEGDPREPPGPA